MNFFDYYFYRMFKSTNTVNKSIPEWSSMITIALLLSLNIFSLLFYFDYPIEKIGRNGFKYIILVLIVISYFYFLFKKRHLKIIEHYQNSKNDRNLLHDLIVLTYACLSIFILFRQIGMEDKYTVGLCLFVIATSVFGYFKGLNDENGNGSD